MPLALLAALFSLAACQSMPRAVPRLVSLSEVAPTVVVEMRYAGEHNFVGRRIDGYLAPRCLLTPAAARAIAAAQAEAAAMGLSLKVYDCYRPQRAVDDFVRWARDPDDEKMKAEFYPRVAKAQLFADGYIDARSGHSRGSTVDLTLVPVLPGRKPSPSTFAPGTPLVDCREPSAKRFADGSLDMGTGYDCFDPAAHTEAPGTAPLARANRARLKSLLEKHGFGNYAKEWWHYRLHDEPYPDDYFDLPVQ